MRRHRVGRRVLANSGAAVDYHFIPENYFGEESAGVMLVELEWIFHCNLSMAGDAWNNGEGADWAAFSPTFNVTVNRETFEANGNWWLRTTVTDYNGFEYDREQPVNIW